MGFGVYLVYLAHVIKTRVYHTVIFSLALVTVYNYSYLFIHLPFQVRAASSVA